MVHYRELRNGLVVTAFWRAKPHEAEAVVGIFRKLMPQALSNPGAQAFLVHQSKDDPSESFFYEVFEDEDAFGARQNTLHYKDLIAGEAAPKRAKRAQYALI